MYFLGIDNGGTRTKSALFDEEGREIAVQAADTPLLTPEEGFNERDPELLWQITAATVAGVIRKAGIDPARIAGVGCTGHGKGLYLWGKEGPLAAVASTDRRAADITRRLKAAGIADRAAERTFQELRECQPVPLLLWYKENRPDIYRDIRWIFEAKDYIRFRLTGEAFAEVTDYSGTGLMNLQTAGFDPELLELYGLSEMADRLPKVKYAHEYCGSVTAEAAALTGLKPGTPVCGGMFDIDACALATGALTENELCIVTGTWSINEYVSDRPVRDCPSTLNSLFCVPGKYLIEESSPTSAGNLEYIMRLLREKEAAAPPLSPYDAVNESAAAVSPAESNVLFFPFLYGTNRALNRGAFLNLSDSTDRGALYRAVLEGVAFSHKTHTDRLLRNRRPPKSVRIAGGAAKSELWLQIFADVLEMPLQVVDTGELGALGAAMAAAVCAGARKDYADAVRVMVRPGKTVMPNPENFEIYRRKYAMYNAFARALEEIE